MGIISSCQVCKRATNRALSVQDLDRALSGYSRLKHSTARSIIAFYDAGRQGAATQPGQTIN